MGSILTRRKVNGISYTASIRLKVDGQVFHSEAQTFPTKALAKEWMTRREAELAGQRARGETVGARMTVDQMVAWYEGLERPDNPWGRTKRADLARIKAGALAGKRVDRLTAADFIEYTNARRAGGAGPATASNDLIWLRQVFRAAKTALRVPVPTTDLDEASDYLRRNRVIAKPKERDRRPTPDELAKLTEYFHRRDQRANIPMHDIMWFAVHSSRRQEEITRLRREDLDRSRGTCLLRDVKHPTKKLGNDRVFRVLQPALDLLDAQPAQAGDGGELFFPYNPKSVGAAFTRACKVLGIDDLHFHDLRHEATSRLFEAGYQIHEVPMFTLHESWATLKRYTNLRPHDVAERPGRVTTA